MSGSDVCSGLVVKGIVQGVGFRPYVYTLACKYGLRGRVENTGGGVEILIEGSPEAVGEFISHLRDNPPPLASISAMDILNLPLSGFTGFDISKSRGESAGHSFLPPDVALCEECGREIGDPRDRRYGYAFTNCTNCGPRYTIVKKLPYDRHLTSMNVFKMCDRCLSEYQNPSDRRFHAQPAACPECGPKMQLVDREGKEVPGSWLESARRLLKTGKILAVKSLGGFHLACSAECRGVLAELRRRKVRPQKPFAIMCAGLGVVKRHCLVNSKEQRLLESPASPVVLLGRRPGCGLPEELAPGMKSLGVMLPYTPLHRLLLSGEANTLVMTSGNISGLPLEKDNREAIGRLRGIADYFLMHNREIVNRCDDSVVGVARGEQFFIRRSRGYVPGPVKVPAAEKAPVVLAVGGEMKNTFCILTKGMAYPGPHLGDLDTVEGRKNFSETLDGFQRIINSNPDVVAFDLHPDYNSSGLARQIPAKRKIAVQHHHSHMASCMAENGITGQVTGVILDGNGFGPDGAMWGFEVLSGDYRDFKRIFHLVYAPLPGGESAIRHPWITAASYLITLLGDEGKRAAGELFGHYGDEYRLVERIIQGGFNCPPQGGCGRLFDAVAAITGVCRENSYEGEAAAKLGELLRDTDSQGRQGGLGELQSRYPFKIEGDVINPGPALMQILSDLKRGVPVREIAGEFHRSLACVIDEAVDRVVEMGGSKRVVLSGGCWQNSFLLEDTVKALENRGCQVFTHRLVPPNDGGLSLGQCMVALAQANTDYNL